MCGLAGILTTRHVEVEASVAGMAGTLVHRGPDDSGTWCDTSAGVALAFRRLAILDLSERGHQPMASPSGRFMLVFNGEIYNCGEIRDELRARGFSFEGHSDTEVIAASFEAWGIARTLPRFNGMFAIAAWDREDRSLTLIRDRLGIKPLFVYHEPGLVMFASELKALRMGPSFDDEIDRDALASYLRHLYVPAPASIFTRVRKLLPGHSLTVRDPDTSLPEPSPFWSLMDLASSGRSEFHGSDDEAVDELDRLLKDSVRYRMLSDVPVGALLSGGIDSSSVVSMMRALGHGAVRTYTVGFDAAEHDEARHAREIADHLSTVHTEIRVSGEDALAVVPQLPELFDEPLADPSQIPTYLVSRLAREEVTVALSGDGGDEVFLGYNRYRLAERLLPRLSATPRGLRLAGSLMLDRLPVGVSSSTLRFAARVGGPEELSRLSGEKAFKLRNILASESDADMYAALMSAWTDAASVVRGGHPVQSRIKTILETPDLPLLDRMRLFDQVEYLPDDLLAKVDRASMAVSLEVRVPLLDHRILEFAWTLPPGLLRREGKGKWILRQVLKRYVPEALFERPKVGFTVPVAAWLRGPLRELTQDLVLGNALVNDAFLRPEPVAAAWKQLHRGEDAVALQLWTVLMFQMWRARWARP